MIKTIFTTKHLDCLSAWAGYKIDVKDNFDALIESDVDFIEFLLLFENHFALDLLEADKTRDDFSTIEEFITWALEHPALEPIHSTQPEDLPFAQHLRQRHYICKQLEA